MAPHRMRSLPQSADVISDQKPHLVRDVPELMRVEPEMQRLSKADMRAVRAGGPRYDPAKTPGAVAKPASMMPYPPAPETAIFRLEQPPRAQPAAPAGPPPSGPVPMPYNELQSPSSIYGTRPPSSYPTRPPSASMSGTQFHNQGPPRTPSQLPPAGAWPPDAVHYSDIPRSAYYEAYQAQPDSFAGTRPDSPAYSTSRPMRQLISCYPCRNRKLKCDGSQPCSQCMRRSGDEECRYADAVRRRGKGKKTARSDDTRSEASIEIIEPTTPERERMRVKHEPASPPRPSAAGSSVATGAAAGPLETSNASSGTADGTRGPPFWRDQPPPEVKQEPAARNGQESMGSIHGLVDLDRVLPPLRALEGQIPPPMGTRAADPPRLEIDSSDANRPAAAEEIDELDEDQSRDGLDLNLPRREASGGILQPTPAAPSGPVRIWEPPATPQAISVTSSRPPSASDIAKAASSVPEGQE